MADVPNSSSCGSQANRSQTESSEGDGVLELKRAEKARCHYDGVRDDGRHLLRARDVHDDTSDNIGGELYWKQVEERMRAGNLLGAPKFRAWPGSVNSKSSPTEPISEKVKPYYPEGELVFEEV